MISAGFKISDCGNDTCTQVFNAVVKACGDLFQRDSETPERAACIDKYVTNPNPTYDANDPVYKGADVDQTEYNNMEAVKAGKGPWVKPGVSVAVNTNEVGDNYHGEKAPFLIALIPKLHLTLGKGALKTDNEIPDSSSGEVGIPGADVQFGVTFAPGINDDTRLHFMPYLDYRLYNNMAVEGNNGMRRPQGYSHMWTVGLEFNVEKPGWLVGAHFGYATFGGFSPFGDGTKFYWPGEGDQVATAYNPATDEFTTEDNLFKGSGINIGVQGAYQFSTNFALSLFADYTNVKDRDHTLGNMTQVGTLPIFTVGLGLMGVLPLYNQEKAPMEKCEGGRIMMGACIKSSGSSSAPTSQQSQQTPAMTQDRVQQPASGNLAPAGFELP